MPHYITSMSYPASSVALLDALREVADIVVDAAQIRQEALIQRGRLDKLVADNADHVQMLKPPRELYDSTGDPTEGAAGGPILELRSGDELAAELEQFLRDQGLKGRRMQVDGTIGTDLATAGSDAQELESRRLHGCVDRRDGPRPVPPARAGRRAHAPRSSSARRSRSPSPATR